MAFLSLSGWATQILLHMTSWVLSIPQSLTFHYRFFSEHKMSLETYVKYLGILYKIAKEHEKY